VSCSPSPTTPSPPAPGPAGARGEEALGAALAQLPGIRVLHDRRVPGTRGNLDHLVVGPASVFVVDAKHYPGNTLRPDDTAALILLAGQSLLPDVLAGS
jgi:hypothetical protein